MPSVLTPQTGVFDGKTERDLATLGRYLDLDRGFSPISVEGLAAAREELRLRFAALVPVDREGSISEFYDELEAGPRLRRVRWLEAETPAELADWIQVLRRGRDALSRDGAGVVVLASGPGLHDKIAREAPDLASVLRQRVSLSGDPTPSVAPSAPLCWLHVSDLHLRATDWRQSVAFAALVRDLPKLLASAKMQPTMVFCTGDVAHRGDAIEYRAAAEALTALCAALGVDPKQRLFVVPGNHDVDRGVISVPARLVQRGCVSDGKHADIEAFNELLGPDGVVRILGERMAAYCGFTRELLGPGRGVDVERPWREDVVEVEGARIGVVSLCSTLLSGSDEDEGRLLLGERQVRDAVERVRDCLVKVALLHHPTGWLHQAERATVEELLASEFHFVLHGHLHHQRTVAQFGSGGAAVFAAAGAAYDDSAWPRRVQVTRFDAASGRVDVLHLSWSGRDGSFWFADDGAGKGVVGGIQTLTLPPLVAVARPAGAAQGLRERLARTAKAVLEPFDFAGFPVPVGRPAAKLAEIFVPQRLVPTRRRAVPVAGYDDDRPDAEFWFDVEADFIAKPTAEIGVADLERRSLTEPSFRVVVLGGAGMGKSTLCRYLGHQVATASKVPVLIRLRDYVGDRDGGLLGFAARQFRERYHVPVTSDELRALADDGAVAFLVDGFDEVRTEDERAQIRDEVVALAEAFPAAALLATSRVIGYDRAPLPVGFEVFELRPFDRAQVRTFVERCYELLLAADPVERRRRTADLMVALERTPSAAELASVPLLATLVVLVHRYRGQLPGSRTKLLGLVVETLVETWPEVSRRTFGRGLSVEQQYRLLQELAYHALFVRERSGVSVTLPIDEAVRVAVEASGVAAGDAGWGARERVVRRWLDWLTEGCGILVESEPGVLEFLHLSIAEYLAASAWLVRYWEHGVQALGQSWRDLARGAGRHEIAVYAASVAGTRMPTFSKIISGIGEFEQDSPDDARRVGCLLDLIVEGTISEDAAVVRVVRLALEHAMDGTVRETFAMLARFRGELWLRAIVPVLLDYTANITVDDAWRMPHKIGTTNEVIAPLAAAVAQRADAAALVLELVDRPEWALAAAERMGALLARAAPRSVPHRSIVRIGRALVDAAPAPVVVWVLRWTLTAVLTARIARTRRGAPRRLESEPWLEMEPCWTQHSLPAGWSLPAATQCSLMPFAADPPVAAGALHILKVGKGPGLTKQPPWPRASGQHYANDPIGKTLCVSWWAWCRSPGIGPPAAPPIDGLQDAALLRAFSLALAAESSADARFWTRAYATDRPLELAITSPAALATTGYWPTPDGKEPTWPDELLAAWPTRYLITLARCLADPAKPQRHADLTTTIDAYPGDDPDLRAILHDFRVVAAGTPEYDAAEADLLARARAAWPEIAADIDAWNASDEEWPGQNAAQSASVGKDADV